MREDGKEDAAGVETTTAEDRAIEEAYLESPDQTYSTFEEAYKATRATNKGNSIIRAIDDSGPEAWTSLDPYR